jgi:polar amino acid transport system permease protein
MATSGAMSKDLPDQTEPSGAGMTGRPPTASARPKAMKAIPVRHWGRWLAATIILLLIASLAYSFANNPRVGWSTIGHYFIDGYILGGVVVTLYLTVIAMAIGVVGGTLIAVMRLSRNPILSAVSQVYIWFFRGTPLLVQLLFWFFFAALYPTIFIGIPFTHVSFFSLNASTLIGASAAAILGLGFNEIAYASELVRAGIISVDKGQIEAAQSLGMSYSKTLRRIILPQAMRVIIPPMGNETISMLKTTSLVIVISGTDLLSRASYVYSQNLQEIPLLITASIWYLILTTIFSVGQYYLERHYARGTGYHTPKRRGGTRGKRWPLRNEVPELLEPGELGQEHR